jgi:AcrR family transcriptional regulator
MPELHVDKPEETRDERERLLDSFTKLAVEVGIGGVSGVEAAERAGLPAAAFHRHFQDERRCLVAAHDAFFERLSGHVAEAVREEGEWPARVRRAISACLECLAEMEGRARLFAVEAIAAGPPILERRFSYTAEVACALREGRRHFPTAAQLAAPLEWLLVAGALAQVTAYLLSEQGSRLPTLEAELTELILLPYLGAEAARRFAARV